MKKEIDIISNIVEETVLWELRQRKNKKVTGQEEILKHIKSKVLLYENSDELFEKVKNMVWEELDSIAISRVDRETWNKKLSQWDSCQ